MLWANDSRSGAAEADGMDGRRHRARDLSLVRGQWDHAVRGIQPVVKQEGQRTRNRTGASFATRSPLTAVESVVKSAESIHTETRALLQVQVQRGAIG